MIMESRRWSKSWRNKQRRRNLMRRLYNVHCIMSIFVNSKLDLEKAWIWMLCRMHLFIYFKNNHFCRPYHWDSKRCSKGVTFVWQNSISRDVSNFEDFQWFDRRRRRPKTSPSDLKMYPPFRVTLACIKLILHDFPIEGRCQKTLFWGYVRHPS